jgi:hypothetical protein
MVHSVEVEARSLYEAVGLAIYRFRQCEFLPYQPGLHEFVVEAREPSSQHRVSRKAFEDWLNRPAGTPREMAQRFDLKKLLGERAPELPGRRGRRE